MKRRLAMLLALAIASGWGQVRRPFPSRFPSRGLRGAVAAGSEAATEAGMRMFLAGGNAVDAGIATMLAASVVEFSHFGFGGEAPILMRTKEGKVFAIAGVGTMPKLGTADFYRKHSSRRSKSTIRRGRNGLKDWVPVVGILPALVPGMVDAAMVGGARFRHQIVRRSAPAGHRTGRRLPAGRIARHRARPAASVIWQPGPVRGASSCRTARVPQAGNIFRQPDLARTLRNMADVEKKALAAGATARQSHGRGARLLLPRRYRAPHRRILQAERRAAALRRHGGIPRGAEEPVSTTFHGYTVYKPGFWSQGPSMIEALNILEGFPIGEMGLNSAEYIHTMAEAMKLAYADRDTYYGDPKFNQIPADALLSKAYGAERRKLIADKASLEFRPGKIGDQSAAAPFARADRAPQNRPARCSPRTPPAWTRSTRTAWRFRLRLRARGCRR